MMKAKFQRDGLLQAFQLASVAVSSQDVKPILKNMKVIVEEDRCTLMATDLELGVRMEVRGVKVEKPGEAIVPCGRMIAILRESTDAELRVEADSERCLVRGEANEYEMAGEDPANFPDVPAFSESTYHELTAGVLREMIKRTIFAAATESPRYAVTGILWELEGSKARLVATDGRRLAVIEADAVSHGGQDTKGQTPVVPTKAMALLERVLQDPDEVVRVCIRPNEVLFKTGRATIFSRLVEGRYPAYREVFPKKSTAKATMTVGPFHTAIRQSAIMTDDKTRRVTFHFAEGKLTLQARGVDTGSSKVEFPIDFKGEEVKINFDPRYLSDMLRIVDADAVLSLDLLDGNSPALFRAGDKYSYVVMPLS